MLSRIEIHNFQSLYDVELELAPFTVIVGPSSSGKSAFIRALHTVIHNRRGLDFLSHGARNTQISLYTPKGSVTLTRGKATEDNHYVIVPTAQDSSPDTQQTQEKFSKLNGAVPESVSRFLGIYPDSGNFASQHDMPYMLKDSGPSVAQTLGKLTNVNVIFDAAREANRQKTAHASTLRTRADDLDVIKQKAVGYRQLKDQTAALDTAEEFIHQATDLTRRIEQLKHLDETVTITEGTLTRLTELTKISVPDLTPVTEAHSRLTAYRGTLTAIKEAGQALQGAQASLTTATAAETDAKASYGDKLRGLKAELASRFTKQGTLQYDEINGSLIEVDEAAGISTAYVVEILS